MPRSVAERKLVKLLSKLPDAVAAKRAAKHRTLCYSVVAEALNVFRLLKMKYVVAVTPRAEFMRACAKLEAFETGKKQ